mmetsp:Transcript_14182/g.24219  ORF Transcript_14182/g.24219 Transcript_14182/m.24219 type:complete len:207 (-) Transcript_14182:128-748(-)
MQTIPQSPIPHEPIQQRSSPRGRTPIHAILGNIVPLAHFHGAVNVREGHFAVARLRVIVAQCQHPRERQGEFVNVSFLPADRGVGCVTLEFGDFGNYRVCSRGGRAVGEDVFGGEEGSGEGFFGPGCYIFFFPSASRIPRRSTLRRRNRLRCIVIRIPRSIWIEFLGRNITNELFGIIGDFAIKIRCLLSVRTDFIAAHMVALGES